MKTLLAFVNLFPLPQHFTCKLLLGTPARGNLGVEVRKECITGEGVGLYVNFSENSLDEIIRDN